jgi:hypothetical protein
MQGIEDGLGGFNEDRTEFNIAMTTVSGVSDTQDPQEILEVSLTLKLDQDPDGHNADSLLPEAGYNRQTRTNHTVSGHFLTSEERQSALALLHTRLANLSQEIPADTRGMRSYLGYSVPRQISLFAAREDGNPWTRSSNRAHASSLANEDTETSSESDDDATEAGAASHASSLVKGETRTGSASHEDTGAQAGESPSA